MRGLVTAPDSWGVLTGLVMRKRSQAGHDSISGPECNTSRKQEAGCWDSRPAILEIKFNVCVVLIVLAQPVGSTWAGLHGSQWGWGVRLLEAPTRGALPLVQAHVRQASNRRCQTPDTEGLKVCTPEPSPPPPVPPAGLT